MLRKQKEKTPLERYRQAAGLSQIELSKKAGVGTSVIGNIETRTTDIENITLGKLLKLAAALDITLQDLIE